MYKLTSTDIDATIRYRYQCRETTMKYVTMTELKQRASRILDEKQPTAIMRNSKVEGYYIPAESLVFDTMDDTRVAELTESILDQRSEVLAYLAKR